MQTDAIVVNKFGVPITKNGAFISTKINVSQSIGTKRIKRFGVDLDVLPIQNII